MSTAAQHVTVALACVLAGQYLTRARWTWQAPRTAILAWQAVGLGWALSVSGAVLSIGLAPYELGIVPALAHLVADLVGGAPPAGLDTGRLVVVTLGAALLLWLVATLVGCLVSTLLTRRRHRALLALVARDTPELPGALVLDHPAAAAYCVPGLRTTVVISAGALRLLDAAQLAAVLAHERAHARERHDLVLLPFAALRRAFPGVALARRAFAQVSLLVEMCADDRASRRCSVRPLVAALLQFDSAVRRGAPAGALAVADHEIALRVSRLLSPRQALRTAFQVLILFAAAVLAGLPIGMFALPV